MEIVVGKSSEYSICLDTIQWGISQDKNKDVNFFAKPVERGNEKNAVNFGNIKVHKDIVTLKDGYINRAVVKDKKAKSIPGAKKKASSSLKSRVQNELDVKYGTRESASR